MDKLQIISFKLNNQKLLFWKVADEEQKEKKKQLQILGFISTYGSLGLSLCPLMENTQLAGDRQHCKTTIYGSPPIHNYLQTVWILMNHSGNHSRARYKMNAFSGSDPRESSLWRCSMMPVTVTFLIKVKLWKLMYLCILSQSLSLCLPLESWII